MDTSVWLRYNLTQERADALARLLRAYRERGLLPRPADVHVLRSYLTSALNALEWASRREPRTELPGQMVLELEEAGHGLVEPGALRRGG